MSKTLALNGFSEEIEDCVKHTAALMQLINRLSDAQIDQSAPHSVHDIEEPSAVRFVALPPLPNSK